MKIVVTCSGGVVTGVFTDEDMQVDVSNVEIVDFDDLDAEEADAADERLEKLFVLY